MEQSNTLNIHSIIEQSNINGPGTRSVVWFQGCKFDCRGCFNQPVRERRENKVLTVKEVLERLPLDKIEGVTISGGEPFLQIDQLYQLAVEIKKRGLSLIIYTGYILSELLQINNINIQEILKLTDILIDGPFIKGVDAVHPWTGSGNQKLYFFTDRYKEYENREYEDLGEVIITETGEIIETGFVEIL